MAESLAYEDYNNEIKAKKKGDKMYRFYLKEKFKKYRGQI